MITTVLYVMNSLELCIIFQEESEICIRYINFNVGAILLLFFLGVSPSRECMFVNFSPNLFGGIGNVNRRILVTCTHLCLVPFCGVTLAGNWVYPEELGRILNESTQVYYSSNEVQHLLSCGNKDPEMLNILVCMVLYLVNGARNQTSRNF